MLMYIMLLYFWVKSEICRSFCATNSTKIILTIIKFVTFNDNNHCWVKDRVIHQMAQPRCNILGCSMLIVRMIDLLWERIAFLMELLN